MSDPARKQTLGGATGLLLCLMLAAPAVAADGPGASHPIVAGFERLDRAEAGRLLLGELSCTACHRATPGLEAHLSRKQAPILDNVGGRVRPSYLRAFLADPRAAKPGTTMPDPFHGWPAAEKDAAVEALTHFLASTGGLTEARPVRKAVADGRTLFHQVGCVACHGPRGEGTAEAADAPKPVPLGDLAAKYTVPSLTAFLLDPLEVRPSGRMPGLRLSSKEANEVAQFLLKDLSPVSRPTLTYAYYEGEWEKLPDFARLKAVATGRAEGLDLTVARRKTDMALRFEGRLRIDRDGSYTFHLRSDDGSKLYVDDTLVVNNDGVHAPVDKQGSTPLTRGSHRFVAEVFNGGNDAELTVEFQGPGLGRRDVSGYLSLDDGPAEKAAPSPTPADPDRLAIDPALVGKGRALFARVGCASCHAMKVDGVTLAPGSGARPLADLAGSLGGCLAESPGRGLPDYHLSAPQRAAMAAALKDAPALGLRRPTHEETIARGLTALNCYACHQRAGVGGVEPSLNTFFETTQREMGDEGRIPPRLDGVGAKLNPACLQETLVDGAKDRPYMLTRMPRFGAAEGVPLASAFAAADRIEPVAAVEFAETTKRVKSAGRSLVGSEGLGCVKCHTFKGSEAEGIQAIDMTVMTRRLRRDWFHRYVVDPPAFRPGTRMPTAWPGGKSILPKVLDGDARAQVEAVWRFLSDGASATAPAGLGRRPMPFYVLKDAVIYRNFIEGAGTRAIGVGYPERANLAFDANDIRLALIWQGGFMDASRHWTGRGEGTQPPMGDNVVALPGGAPFATLASPTAPWPVGPSKAQGYRFRGYRVTADGRPTFLYEFGATRVEDRPDGVAGIKAPGLARTIVLTSDAPPDRLWFRAAVGDSIKPTADGGFLVNGEWRVRFGPDNRAVVRPMGGRQELLVPVKFRGKTATLSERFEW